MIRRGVSADQIRIVELLESSLRAGDIWPGRWNERMVVDALESGSSFVAELDGAFAGFLFFRPPGEAWEIDLVAVAPWARRTGVFRNLLETLHSAEVAARHHPLTKRRAIWLEVHEGNGNAIKAYQRCGFREVSRRPGYYPDGGAAILMTKDCL